MLDRPTKLQEFKTFIDGKWCGAASGKTFETHNPYTGEPWALIPECDRADVDQACEAAWRAFDRGPWPAMTQTARGRLLRRIGALIEQHAQHLAEIEVRDNGKLMSEMHAQTRYLPEWFYYYGGLADKIHGAVVPVDRPDHFNYTLKEPVGVCAFITPWNSPLMLVGWKLAPALAAGCTVVIKPSEFTSASLLEFMRLVIEPAEVPPGVVNVVTGYGAVVGEPLVTHPKVAKVAFTGGTATGARVNELAAKSFKKVSLELGGKSPNIVFDDCVLDDAVSGAVSGIFAATGQTCIAGSRLLLQETIHDRFVEKLVAMAKQARLGDPSRLETQVGPVTTPPQYQKVLSYIDIAKGEGATCVLGGGPATKEEGGGKYFVKPTIFTGVDNRMRIAQEEVFGPVLSVIKFKDEEEAVAIANDIAYGLGAGVWTQSIKRATTMAKRIRAGTVWVNTYRAVSFTMPFGGYKASGLGRENGMEAIEGYLQTKSVWINNGPGGGNPFIMKTAG
ncbi:MAG: aldehyde dehydrogenase [Xanthobacteraceae bacterium]|nr:aldehyde dehydrogenase [Xanthobacteraceae bacterium]PWB61409.1 MAG: carnitine dehydratase [Bradyrhizobiaceae bacterium]